MNWIDQALQNWSQGPGVCVTVRKTLGSVPRGPGTAMVVLADAEFGTIGGGHLEYQAVAHARRMLAGQTTEANLTQVLGPSLGQCCGGSVQLGFELVHAADVPALRASWAPLGTPLALFGGGHVGKALVKVLASLPFAVRWIDSRDEIFPNDVPPQVHCEHASPVHAAVNDLPADSQVLIMSFSHAEDFDVVIACLKRIRTRDDLPFVGLIGSKTKWATFKHRLESRGFTNAEIERITCPIGVPGIAGKEPEVIAVAVAAQLLQAL